MKRRFSGSDFSQDTVPKKRYIDQRLPFDLAPSFGNKRPFDEDVDMPHKRQAREYSSNTVTGKRAFNEDFARMEPSAKFPKYQSNFAVAEPTLGKRKAQEDFFDVPEHADRARAFPKTYHEWDTAPSSLGKRQFSDDDERPRGARKLSHEFLSGPTGSLGKRSREYDGVDDRSTRQRYEYGPDLMDIDGGKRRRKSGKRSTKKATRKHSAKRRTNGRKRTGKRSSRRA